MTLMCTVGGAKATFEARYADEVAALLDQAFGGESDWEGTPPRHFGALDGSCWADLQERAVAELGVEAIPNLLAMGPDEAGVYLPAQVQPASLPLSAGDPLRCASLPGLRAELAELADRWDLPWDDDALLGLLRDASDPDGGPVADAPEVVTFARLALAANEAVRRDCPLWLVK
ncbi:MAG: hypothetical protein ABI353_20605 [Isosphaeraceae bacterium]